MIAEELMPGLWRVRGIVRGVRVVRIVSAPSRHAANERVLDELLGVAA